MVATLAQIPKNKRGIFAYKGNKIKILIGDKIGRWTFIEECFFRKDGNGIKRYYAKVQCSCGKIKTQLLGNLLNLECGTRRSINDACCLSCAQIRRGDGYKEVTGYFLAQCNQGTKSRGLSFNITGKDVYDLYISQNKKCALSGIDIVFGDKGYGIDTTVSLDRIDSSYGYTPDNIQLVHKHINKMKMEFSQEYFIQMCNLVSKNYSNGC